MTQQETGIRRTVLFVLCIICLVISGFIWKMDQPVVMNDQELRANGAIVLNTPRVFSDFELLDHHGEVFSKEQLKGKWSMIFFGFTQCPDICPLRWQLSIKLIASLKRPKKTISRF